MNKPAAQLAELLRGLEPRLQEGTFAFASAPADADLSFLEPIATFREAEGLSVIVPEARALQTRLPVLYRAAWITLTVRSELHAVGLTAAVATALAEAGISCNVVAAVHHDHIFVPAELAGQAMSVLRALQRNAAE
jgi:hypothetical protein